MFFRLFDAVEQSSWKCWVRIEYATNTTLFCLHVIDVTFSTLHSLLEKNKWKK